MNYGVVAAELLQCSADVKVRTIERLARLMGEKIMQQHPEVVVATIRLEKLLPPSPQIFRSAEVELTLERIRGIEGAGTYR